MQLNINGISVLRRIAEEDIGDLEIVQEWSFFSIDVVRNYCVANGYTLVILLSQVTMRFISLHILYYVNLTLLALLQ